MLTRKPSSYSSVLRRFIKSDSNIVKKKHESEVSWKFKNLMKFEVYPVLGLSALVIGSLIFKDSIKNLLPFHHLSKRELLLIGRKLAPVMRFKYEETILSPSRIESSLIFDLLNLALEVANQESLWPETYIIDDQEEDLALLPNGCLFLTTVYSIYLGVHELS